MQEKMFTLQEANRLLPQLEPLFRELIGAQSKHDAMQDRHNELYFKVANNGQNFETEELVQLKEKLESMEERIDRLAEKIETEGAIIKGMDPPLLDFPANVEGRKAYLCWQLGEDEIRYWHDLDSGFSGRQPLTGAGNP
jgi:hypothetical protein